jgi:hypothetical protein
VSATYGTRVSVARETMLNGTVSELKHSNYDPMFDLSNCFVLQTTGLPVLTKYTFDNFIIIFQNNVFGT